MSQRQHIWALRWSIAFVAVFSFFFSLLFPIREYIWMFFMITSAIYLGGAGSVIVGGLYWKRGTAAGAWTAMIVGCLLAVSTITAQQVWPKIPEQVANWYGLTAGQQVQMEAETVKLDEWTGGDGDQEGQANEPAWVTHSQGFTLKMTRLLGRGAEAGQELPQQESKQLRDGTEILVGAKPATISEIVADPNSADSYVLRAKITEVLGDCYYRIAGANGGTAVAKIAPAFPINGTIMSFACALAGIISYVVVSLITGKGRATVDMDRLFHRGKYAVKEEEDYIKEKVKQEKPIGRLWRLIGVNSHEFSRVDKGLYIYTVAAGIFWTVSFVFLLLLGLAGKMRDAHWMGWWKVALTIQITIGFIGGTWISIGGLVDLRKMYRRLATAVRDEQDDGRILDSEEPAEDGDNTREST